MNGEYILEEKLLKKMKQAKYYKKKYLDEKEKINRAIEYIEIIQNNESYGVKEKDYLNLLDILKGE